jgi:alpha-L-fucosidase
MRSAGLIPLAIAASLIVAIGGQAQEKNETSAPLHADPASVKWFRQARFGMFIHWGIYSLLGRGEWVMNNEKIPIAEYENLAPQFNPTEFNAHEWVQLAKEAGAKYITITSKHHDGFCMFNSRLTDWDIIDRTPFKRDPLKELADECHRQGIKLFFYYSQLDWHHPDYFPRGSTGKTAGRPESGDWERYKEYYIGQVRELCTNYGEIGGIWFDGWWDKPTADWSQETLYPMIHRLQPKALVGNNHHHAPFPGEDFQMFEQDLPGENTAGFNQAGVSDLPKETCRTINNSWGLNTRDTANKSGAELTRYLIQAAGRDANLLLNTGPLPTGKILPEHQERYREIGRWLKMIGSIVYNTRGGPFPPAKWGVSTCRGTDVFLHILNWPADNVLHLPPMDAKVHTTRSYKAGRVKVEQSPSGITLTLAETLKDPVDSLVVLELDREALTAKVGSGR